MTQSDLLFGIDLGGTKIEGVVIHPSSTEVICRHRIPTEGDNGYEHVLSRIKIMVDQLASSSGVMPSKIGIGTPGILDPIDQLMKNCNATSLNGKPMKKDLEALLGITVNMSNDANCFAIAEAMMGVVRDEMSDATNVFGVIMGTGVGGGVVIDGKVIAGRQGIGGEWGHNLLEPDGHRCYCGRVGCVETVISGPALERYYQSLTQEAKPLKKIVALYREGNDDAARATMERLFTYFGKGIAVVINILDPDAIVIGGGVGNIDELYTLGVEAARPHVFNHHMQTRFFKPKLGDSAGVFGAAFL